MTPQRCAQCGAMIDPLAHACPYCQFTTPAGVAAHQQRQHQAQWAAHATHQQMAAAVARMKSTSMQSLIFGILGMLIFCTPLGIVGIIQGVRARGMSREVNAPVPGTATAGLILSILSIVTSIAGIYLLDKGGREDEAAAKQRAAAIEQRLGARPSAKVLERDVACGLAEAHVLREGHGGKAGYHYSDFQCIGRFESTEDRAEIDVIRAKYVDVVEFRACFKRGEKWYVSTTTTLACPD